MANRPKKISSGALLLAGACERLAHLTHRPELMALESLARRRGERIWIVGGAVRDLLLGRRAAELDVAVQGNAETLALEMESAGLGTKVLLSDESPRVFRVAGTRDLDIAEVTGGSIEADLARRDFSVNAIALDPVSHQVLDPFDGIMDLAQGRLRLISEENLRQDPLRVLRAARLFATHGLAPDRGLTTACRGIAEMLATVAPERIRAELVRILESVQASDALRWLRAVDALAPCLGMEPSRIGSRSFASALSHLNALQVRRSLPGSRRRLRLCLVAAGLGLPSPETARWLARRRFSREEAGEVAALLDLANRAHRARTPAEQWGWVRDSGARRSEALILTRLTPPRNQALIRRLAGRRPVRPVRVTGSDVMRWLNILPGPAVGTLLREIEIEGIRGRVRSRPEARKWLLESPTARSMVSRIAPRERTLPDS